MTTASLLAGERARIGVSGVEVECVIMSVVAGLMTVTVKRTPAKAEHDASRRGKRRA